MSHHELPWESRLVPGLIIDRLIVNSVYEGPVRHWRNDRTTRLFKLEDGLRPAEYAAASGVAAAFDDPGVVREIPVVNRIPEPVKAWRANGYCGVTGITKRFLQHWRDPEELESRRCDLESVGNVGKCYTPRAVTSFTAKTVDPKPGDGPGGGKPCLETECR